MKSKQKPVRVITGQVGLFTCPVCRTDVMGDVEVEAHLGDLTLRSLTDDTRGDPSLVADVPVVTNARSLRVNHQCGNIEAPQAVDG